MLHGPYSSKGAPAGSFGCGAFVTRCEFELGLVDAPAPPSVPCFVMIAIADTQFLLAKYSRCEGRVGLLVFLLRLADFGLCSFWSPGSCQKPFIEIFECSSCDWKHSVLEREAVVARTRGVLRVCGVARH